MRSRADNPSPALTRSLRLAVPARLACAIALAGLLLSGFPSPLVPQADEPSLESLAGDYVGKARPLVQKYCRKCHSGDQPEAELDLESMATFADVRKNSRAWQKVGEMLESGQMPPRDAKQPAEDEHAQLRRWVRAFLSVEARATAGDPGPVVLRRLSHAEYTYTLRDLTGVETLEPAREFPVDGAAGEGFTNAGQALVVSPAMITKYLDAAKKVAAHAVLLPDGMRFSPHATRRDWTNEALARIREFYRGFSDARGGDRVNLQGIVFDTNQGGRLPIENYLAATLAEREGISKGTRTLDDVARERGLNAKYLGTLWTALTASAPSLLLDGLRARWRAAKKEDAVALAAEVAAWQKALWKFSTVGHIGKIGGPKRWMEPVVPLAATQEIRVKVPAPAGEAAEVVLHLVAGDAGDGNENDFVVWKRPRLTAPGQPELLLKDVRETARELSARRERLFADAAKYLQAAQEAAAAQGKADLVELARRHGVEADPLRAWLDYLGIGSGGPFKIEGYLTQQLLKSGNYDFIKGWGRNETPLLVANSSDQHVRIPGNMKPHSVAVHPSPTLQSAVGWRSPVTSPMRVEARIVHAHPECGNGVTWALELRRGATRQRLAAGTAQAAKEGKAGPFETLAVQAGDLVTLLVGPRDGNHSCDLTAVDLKLTEGVRTWSLADDVSPDVLAGNPHADRLGNDGVWHFFTEPAKGGAEPGPVIPAGSLLARWVTAPNAEEKRKLADEVQRLLTSGPPAAKESPDAAMFRQLASRSGPLLRGLVPSRVEGLKRERPGTAPPPGGEGVGLDPAMFGGGAIDPGSLRVRAPSVIEVRLPADLAAGCELVTSGALDPRTGAEGSVQLQVLTSKPSKAGLVPSDVTVTVANVPWTSDGRTTSVSAPVLVNDGSSARKRVEAAMDDFRGLFPAALCYTKIVPVDEVVTLTLFYREDDHLSRLMLDGEQRARLDRLWDELHYVSHDALTLVDAYAQLMEFATQDANPKVFEPLREPIKARAAAFRQRLIDTEPRHLDALLDFAGRAYRRPLADAESGELRALYATLRKEGLPHDDAVRLTLARVLVSPAFLYRLEKPGPGQKAAPVTDAELATRLSYFLWSSPPDAELREVAAAGRLRDPETLVAQARRMIRDIRVRRLATEFACQWLHVYDFDQLDEKSDRHFPSFLGLRGAMYEETIRFFTDLFQRDGSVLEILDSDHTFLNEALAKHYAIPGVKGAEWRRVDGAKKFSRGGILAQAATLSKQSGASRTSPILRGNWISEVLLGERLPRPPKDVPQLPQDEAAETLTVRQLVEKHSSDPRCAVCHRRIDGFGFSLETFDAIGRRRDKDLGGRPIDTGAKAPDGAPLDGLDGLRAYLLTVRRDAFLRQFCRKLLGYSLGRSVQLSDEPLLAAMQAELKAREHRIVPIVELIVRSPQFREIRGRDRAYDD